VNDLWKWSWTISGKGFEKNPLALGTETNRESIRISDLPTEIYTRSLQNTSLTRCCPGSYWLHAKVAIALTWFCCFRVIFLGCIDYNFVNHFSILTTWTGKKVSPWASHGRFSFKPRRNERRPSLRKSDVLLDSTVTHTYPFQVLPPLSFKRSFLRRYFPRGMSLPSYLCQWFLHAQSSPTFLLAPIPCPYICVISRHHALQRTPVILRNCHQTRVLEPATWVR